MFLKISPTAAFGENVIVAPYARHDNENLKQQSKNNSVGNAYASAILLLL